MPSVSFNLNGKDVSAQVDGKELLVDTIRQRFLLTGTKKACGTSDCGTCTVLVDGVPLRSCAYLTCMAQDKRVVTIEGLGTPDDLHPLQQAFIDASAVQCGYCIPGMILTALALIKENPRPTKQEIREALSGNLCRCTGYEKIIIAIQLAAERMLAAKEAPPKGGSRA